MNAPAAMIIFDAIPAELRAMRRWVVWKLVLRPGAKKPTKVPFQARAPRLEAESDNPATWATFDEARAAYEAGGFAGIGIMLGDGLAGVDLDYCIDVSTGAMDDAALAIIEQLDTYAEISPSGTGIKFFLYGTLPSDRGRRFEAPWGGDEGRIELYDHGRFFAVTGNAWPGAPGVVEDRGEQLRRLFETCEAKREAKRQASVNGNGHRQTEPRDISMADRVERCVKYIEKCPDAISGQDGHGKTLRVACECVRFDLDASGTWEIMRHFNDRKTGGEQWSDSELQHKIESARDRAGHERGIRLREDRRGYKGNGSGHAKPLTSRKEFSAPEAADDGVRDFPLTDAGNGERLFGRHGGKLVRVALWNKWAHYTGTHLQIDNTGEADRLALETLRHMKHRGAQMAKSEDEDQHALGLKLIKWAHKCESDGRIGAMLNRAAKVKGATILPDQLDTNPWLLNCQNGTLDLQTFELRPHRREDFITKLCPVKYDPSLTCPQFLAFLNQIFQSNERLIAFVRRMIGYSLTGVTSERAIFILYGCGANGKSTLLAVLRDLLGPYAMQTGADTLMAKKQEGIRNDIARLKGARLVSAIESDEGRYLAEGLVKNLSGGSDAITARFLYSEEFEFVPEFKIYLATNHRPIIRGTDSAIWDRIKLIPFDVRFYDTAEEAEDACGDPSRVKDKDLLNKLKTELGGILAWAVEGCREWQRDGLGAPEEVQQATQQYREDMDRLGDFISDCCIVGPGLKAAASDLYTLYKTWASLNGEDAMSQTKFGRELEQKGFHVDRDGTGRKRRLGIGIKVSEQS